MGAAILLLAATATLPFDGKVPGHGFCIKETWVDLMPGEVATFNRGPDGYGYRVTNSEGLYWEAASDGIDAMSADGDGFGKVISRYAGHVVRRTRYAGKSAFLIANTRRSIDGLEETIFDAKAFVTFGPAIPNGPRSQDFFRRMSSGQVASDKCAKFWKLWR